MAHPATKTRGGNPGVKPHLKRKSPTIRWNGNSSRDVEESMTGSDPVSVTQPPKTKHQEKNDE
jgi:hypothetical protein